MKKDYQSSIYHQIIFVTLILMVIFFQFLDLSSLGYIKDVEMIKNSITRFATGIVLMFVLIQLGYGRLFYFRHIGHAFLIMIPAFLISINNFPIIAYLDGRAFLNEPDYRVILYLIECLSVGFFEEIVFRGILLVILFQQLSNAKHGMILSVIISSLVFGMLHVVNLFSGASITSTLLQIGYSFLMGMLWAVMYLKTGNLWMTMLLHASYNFFGQVMFHLGVVQGRFDIYTILITIILATGSGIYAIKLLKNHPFASFLKIIR
jgi:uncharacterized protein